MSNSSNRVILPREAADDASGLRQRDELWNLLMPPKSAGCESWVLPWPSVLDAHNLVIKDYNEVSSYLDDRHVRLVIRTRTDAERGEFVEALILTPARRDLADLGDARLQLAMLLGWGRLTQYLKHFFSGNKVTLLQFLRWDASRMVKELQDRLSRSSNGDYFAAVGLVNLANAGASSGDDNAGANAGANA
ncbi:hypothetical protein PG984_005646 [Apiospora sp. TS-2023a]